MIGWFAAAVGWTPVSPADAAGGGEPYAWYAVGGLGVNLTVLYLLLWRFNTILHL